MTDYSCDGFSHNKKQFYNQKNKNLNFIFFKKINKVYKDPVPNFIEIVKNNKYSFLYESVEKEIEKGRYTICGYRSIKTVTQVKNNLKIDSLQKNKIIKNVKNPLTEIDKILKKNVFHKAGNLPPMAGSFLDFYLMKTFTMLRK